MYNRLHKVLYFIITVIFLSAPSIFSQGLKLTSPNGGEQWNANSAKSITWQSDNVTKVKIEYSLSNGLSWYTLSPSVDAYLGNYLWIIEDAQAQHVLIRISDASNPDIFDVSDKNFSIIKSDEFNKSPFVESTIIKIMPLGDSITQGVGVSTEVGYRESLFNLLKNAGYNFSFVGTQITGLSSDTAFFNNGRHHEGHGGWSAYLENGDPYGYSLHDDLRNFLVSYQPNVVLLHIGTNDISANYSGPNAIYNDTPQSLADEVVYLLDTINNYNTNVITILARIINRTDSYSQKTSDFNDSLQHRVDSLIALGRKIVVVDMEAALIYPSDLADGLHPNASGYQKMANAWFDSLQYHFRPIPASPSNNAVNQPINLTLTWNAPPVASTMSVNYNVQISTDSLFINNIILDDQNVNSTSRSAAGLLDYGIKYYWRVRIPGYGWSAKWNFTTLSAPPDIISIPDTTAIYGQLHRDTVRANGYPAPKYYLDIKPTGMLIDSLTGIIQWTANTLGINPVRVRAVNTWGSDTLNYNIQVTGTAPSITSTAVLTGRTGQLYTYDVNATGNPSPKYYLGIKPTGMLIDSVTGIIQWTPVDSGSYSVKVLAKNGVLPDAEQNFIIAVELAIPADIISIPDTTAIYGQLHRDTVRANGYPAPKYYLDIKPTGMLIDSLTGIIQWTANTLGINPVRVRAVNTWGSDTLNYNIQVTGTAPSITSTAVLTGRTGQLYTYDVNATGNPSPKYYLGIKPTGMLIDSVTGIIQWTPVDSGSYSVKVLAKNGVLPDAEQNFTIAVELAIPADIISIPDTTAIYGQLHRDTVRANGYPAPKYYLDIKPTGMLIDSLTGIIQWTANTLGINPVRVRAVNTWGSDTLNYNIQVTGTAPSITSTAVLTGRTGQLYTYDVNATGNPSPKYYLGIKPTGMLIDSVTGIIQWTPVDSGSYSVKVLAKNGVLPDAEQNFIIAVELAIPADIISIPDTTAIYGQLHRDTVRANGYPAPKYYLDIKPTGMLIDSLTGIIQWTANTLGINPVRVRAVNTWGSDTLNYNIQVTGTAPSITSTAVLTGRTGQLYTYDVNATGNPSPKYYLGIKPTGMVIDSVTGIIQWTPVDSGSYSVKVLAKNGVLPDAEQNFIIAVELAIPADIISIPDTTAIYGQLHIDTVRANGYPAPKYYLDIKPTGMVIDSLTGIIQWTANTLGINPVRVRAVNTWGSDTLNYNIQVTGTAPSITSTAVLTGRTGQLYTYDVNATGNPSPKYYLGIKPTGMLIDSVTGIIQWTPVDSGSYSVKVLAKNGVLPDAEQNFTIAVELAIPADIISIPDTTAIYGQLHRDTVRANGYPAPKYYLDIKPTGMLIDSLTGIIQWTANTLGINPVRVRAVNTWGSDTLNYNIQVTGTAPSITSTAVTNGGKSQLYTYDVNATGNPSPKYYLGIKPTGMVIDSLTGIIQWTPADSGSYNVKVLAKNGVLPDAEQNFIIAVELAIPADIISIPRSTAMYGQLHIDTVRANGYPAPKYYLDIKPSGMVIDSVSGIIQWTPGTLGINAVRVRATNKWGADTLNYSIQVSAMAPVITSTAVLNGIKGQLYTYDVNATGSPTPKYYLGIKPTGMLIDSVTGIIQWTPADSGSYSVKVIARNFVLPDAEQSYTINVKDLSGCAASMIAYWKLDEISGNRYIDHYNGNDGQAGTNAPIPIVGKINGGQQFDGVNDEINVAASTDFDFGANENFSIEFWMKYSGSIQDVNVIIGRDDAATQLHWWIGLIGAESNIAFYLTSKTGQQYNVIGTTGLNDGNWHHITAVRDADANQIKIYADGKLEGSAAATYSNGFDSPTTNLNIGWLNLDDGYHYNGALDEVAMYRSVLDTTTIQRHYFGGIGGKSYCEQFILAKVSLNLEGPYDIIK